MNPLAVELNEKIISVNPVVYEMLSELGKRIYFPSKGILSQSAEANKLAKKFNASIGTALESGRAMYLSSVIDSISGVSPNDALLYAPSQGTLEIRNCGEKRICMTIRPRGCRLQSAGGHLNDSSQLRLS